MGNRTVKAFDDGSIYVERPGSRWGRVKVYTGEFLQPSSTDLEVCYVPVADGPINTDNKGSTIKINNAMFDYLDRAHNHTASASKWMRTPKMLWINRLYVGDPLGSTLADGADPVPVTECITGSCNILRVIGETSSHFEIEASPMSEDIRKYNPAVFNWYNYPWIFWKALARKRDGTVMKVGSGLDVFHMNIRKPANRHYIHKSRLTLFRQPPFTIGGVTVIDYQFLGADIYGVTENKRIPLLVNGIHRTTEWNNVGTAVV